MPRPAHDADRTADTDGRLARIAGAIAEPARSRMLCSLMDGRARTATELATLAEVAPSTASVHLARLRDDGLLSQVAQGKHRYFRLASDDVAAALEGLMFIAGAAPSPFAPNTPSRLRVARTCYDHVAGALGVQLHDRLHAQGWLSGLDSGAYQLSEAGALALQTLGLDIDALRQRRRRFACPCLDWSERRNHLGGALGAGWLALSLRRGWLRQGLDDRALAITPKGVRELPEIFALGEPRQNG